MQIKYKTLFDNTLIFAIGIIGSRLITFLLVPLYTNVLTREEYGTADLVMTYSLLLVPLVSLVIQDSLLRFGLSDENQAKKAAIISSFIFFIGSVCTIVFFSMINLGSLIEEWKWYLVQLIITTNASNILYVYAKTKDQNKVYSVAAMLHAFVLAVLNIILLLQFDMGVEGFLLANIVSNIVSCLFIIYFTNLLKDLLGVSLDFQLMIKMLRYSIPLIANNISWWFINSSNRILIQKFASVSDLGLFTVASKLPAILTIIVTIFSSAWTISSIKEYDSDKDKKFYSNIFKYFSLTLYIVAVLLILFVRPIMYIFVGNDFFIAWKLVPFLVLGSIYYSYAIFFGAIYNAIKKNIMVTISTVITAVMNVVLNVILIQHIGVIAASIATFISFAFLGLYRMIDSQKYFSFFIDYKKITINSIIIVLQSIIVTLNIHVYSISFAAFISLLVINRDELAGLKEFILRRIRGNDKINRFRN